MSQGKLLELGVVFYSNAIYHHSYYSQMSEIVEDLLSTGVNQDSFFETMSSCSVGKFIPLFSSTKLYSSCKKKSLVLDITARGCVIESLIYCRHAISRYGNGKIGIFFSTLYVQILKILNRIV